MATIWIQAFTGTNFDFSAYSSEMKMKLGVPQVQLNYLATASDLGKALGWSSGLALNHLPLWTVMFIAASMGLVGYGVQWLVINGTVAAPYFVVLLLCLLAGCSICWFNTVCFVLCIKNFPSNRPLAVSLMLSFNGLSAALYNLAANSFSPSSTSVYLLLNALLPLVTSIVALIPILRQPPVITLPPDVIKRDQVTFVLLNFLAVITGLYLLFLHPSNMSMACLLFAGAIFLLVLPLGIPGIIYAREWFKNAIYTSFQLHDSGFTPVDAEDLELHKQLLSRENSAVNCMISSPDVDGSMNEMSRQNMRSTEACSCDIIFKKDQLVMLGEEHKAKMLIRRLDFWLYFVAYFCGGTIGLVYSNNLGQIAQSLGHSSFNSRLITIYSSFSFFGRLLSAAPDFIGPKAYFARTGWLTVALLPTPIAFALLAVAGNDMMAVQVGTALIGFSSGFIFAAAVSITSELFGPNSAGVNHNILIANIPIGSLVYGFLAAIVYDMNGTTSSGLLGDPIVCMGKKCYFYTFVWWGCISVLGLASSLLLFLRTRPLYLEFGRNRISPTLN